MAEYKQPCNHCGALTDRDVQFCTVCGARNPFGYKCPTCLRTITKEQTLCSGCGRQLYITCPLCGGKTFVGDRCDSCGAQLMIKCPNRRCEDMQFFENEKCTSCGTLIKPKYRVLTPAVSVPQKSPK